MFRPLAVALALVVAVALPAIADFDTLWPLPAVFGPDWEVLLEAPEPVDDDPDLRRWGVVARETRHYTRAHGRLVEVCSVELWAFASEEQARAAHAGFAMPDWRIDRTGTLLVMLRSRTLLPGTSPSRAIFDDCREIGRRVAVRAIDWESGPVPAAPR